MPVLEERTAADAPGAVAAADALGYPVVLKLCGETIAHKTERGLVRLELAEAEAVRLAAVELLAAARPDDGSVELLIAPMVRGTREFIAGLVRDPQFGPCVMFGVGGVLAEALGDVAFRLAPLNEIDAAELLDDLETQKLLGPFRGEHAVDRAAVVATLVGLSRLAQERPDVAAVDLNPLIVVDGRPVAVDALVEIADGAPPERATARARPGDDGFRALFEPRGVIVAGASSHPGKFGFVALHNILSSGYAGRVGATNLEATPVLGIECVRTIDDLPDGPWDLVFVCTPAGANADLLRACARRGVRAAFLTSAGYGEAGEEGIRAQQALVALADELGILLAGPNGQGVVSTPAHLCAQIVAPYPPAGRIAIASQSGNFVSSFENWAVQTGVGVSRAVSAGNAAAVGVADYLDWYADDDASAVSLAYVEGVDDGRALFDRLENVARRKPVVLVKGGTTASGQRAAASHTGSLAADDRIFDGMCRQAGITRAATVEEAFEAAATFATQPRPRGPRTAVLTTAGGWGVVTADAIARAPGLELALLPARSAGRDRREAPAPLEPQQPDRLRGRRDARHDSRGHGARRAASRYRRDRLPRARHPVEHSSPAPRRGVLSRPRPRTHRRLPRAPGRALRAGRGRHLRRDRQADPHRDRARGRRARQSGTGNRSRHGSGLLFERKPGGDGALTSLARRALPDRARIVVT